MPEVFNAGLETSGEGEEIKNAGRRSEDGDKKKGKKDNGNGEASKKRTRTPEGGRRKTRSDTQH